MPRSVRHTAPQPLVQPPLMRMTTSGLPLLIQDPTLTSTLQEILRTVSDNQRLLRARTATLMARFRSTEGEGRLGCVSDQPIIRTARDVWDLLGEEMSTLVQEQLRVLLLTTKGCVLRGGVIYQGTIQNISIRAAEVLRPAVLANAPAIIVVHNHSSGDPDPRRKTYGQPGTSWRLVIQWTSGVLDHIILGSEGRFVSMQECGLVRQRTEGAAAA